jgi:uncharacterized membrane protein YoaK (UPF0700 family)
MVDVDRGLTLLKRGLCTLQVIAGFLNVLTCRLLRQGVSGNLLYLGARLIEAITVHWGRCATGGKRH